MTEGQRRDYSDGIAMRASESLSPVACCLDWGSQDFAASRSLPEEEARARVLGRRVRVSVFGLLSAFGPRTSGFTRLCPVETSRKLVLSGAPPCFPIVTPHAEPGHRGLYLALVCREPVRARQRSAFLVELCDLLEVPRPDPKADSGYAFEFPVVEHLPDGSTRDGRIDLYKRAAFLLEAKQFQDQPAQPTDLQLALESAGAVARKRKSAPVRGTGAWDDAMLKARGQS
jgi:hypothetical protein